MYVLFQFCTICLTRNRKIENQKLKCRESNQKKMKKLKIEIEMKNQNRTIPSYSYIPYSKSMSCTVIFPRRYSGRFENPSPPLSVPYFCCWLKIFLKMSLYWLPGIGCLSSFFFSLDFYFFDHIILMSWAFDFDFNFFSF